MTPGALIRDDAAAARGSVLFSIRVAAVLALTLPIIWLILCVTPSGPPMHRRVRRFARLVLRLCGCRLSVSGLEQLARVPCAVLVANHQSYLDAVVLAAAIPLDCRFVVNHLAATRPLVGLIVRRSGHVVVDRGSTVSRANGNRASIRLLQEGASVLLFPEGTRASDEMRPFHGGAFLAASKSGRPVVPIAIRGTGDIWPVGLRLFRPGSVDVRILPPIEAEAMSGDAQRLKTAAAAAIAGALSS